MRVVVDSTITVAWLFENEANSVSEAVLDQLVNSDAVVPAVWQLEVTNALLDAQSHGRLSEAQAIRFLALLDHLPITVDHSGDDTTAVHAAARQHNLSAYQASYLVLAERLALPLVTSDGVLAGAARRAGASLVAAT